MDLLPAHINAAHSKAEQADQAGNEANELSERRQAAFLRAKKHSRVVYVLKRVLPVLSIFCVSFYFYTGEFSMQFGDLKASVEKVEVSRNELKMTNPRLEGHDKKAGSYLVTADTATQKANSPYIINLKSINGKLSHPKNGTILLEAKNGVFDTQNEILDLSEDLVVRTPNGMVARLKQAHIVFKKQTITSDAPVFIQMKSSTIRAETMHIDGISKIITFSNKVRVKLVKTPEK